MHFFAPHSPYNPPKNFNIFSNQSYAGSKELLSSITKAGTDISDSELEQINALYDGEIFFIDYQLRKFFRFLENNNVLNNTIVVLVGDHGEDLYQHNRYFYHACSIYDTSLKIPLILRLPDGSLMGKRVEGIVEMVDIAPTILDLLNLSKPSFFQGASVMPMISHGTVDENHKISLSEWNHKQGDILSIRTKEWRYIYNPNDVTPICLPKGDYYKVAKEELYNIQKDPGETLNIVEKNPKVAEMLREKLLRLYPKGNDSSKTIRASEEALEELRSLGYLV